MSAALKRAFIAGASYQLTHGTDARAVAAADGYVETIERGNARDGHKQWVIPGGRCVADRTAALLIYEGHTVIVRTVEEYGRAHTFIIGSCAPEDRIQIVNALLDAHVFHLRAVIQSLEAKQ